MIKIYQLLKIIVCTKNKIEFEFLNMCKNKHNNMNNFYEQNFNSVNRYMFIFVNIFVLYFFPYLYFISYIVILYQRLDVDFNIRISNNRLSIDKLVFKNVEDEDQVQHDVIDADQVQHDVIDAVHDDVIDTDQVQHDDVINSFQDDVIDPVQYDDNDIKIMRKFFDILKNNVADDEDDNTSVINNDDNNDNTIDTILDTIQ